MSKAMTMATAVLTGASVLAFWGGALAQTRVATQADFDQCNREAQMAVSASASPSGNRAGAAPTTPQAGTSISTPGADASASRPGPQGSGALSTGGTSDAAGATGATGSVRGGSTISGGQSAGAASVSGDAQFRGMASAGANDPAYQQAYRDCMRRRGF